MAIKKCPYCGEEILEVAIKCKHCQSIISPGRVSLAQQEYPGFWTRVVAALLDSMLISALNFILIITYILTIYSSSYNYNGGGDIAMLLIIITSSIIWYVYLPGTYGATPGKMILKLKIVYNDGKDITLGTAFVRNVIGYFISGGITLGIGHLFIVFHPEKKGLHDLIAGTKVIYRDR